MDNTEIEENEADESEALSFVLLVETLKRVETWTVRGS